MLPLLAVKIIPTWDLLMLIFFGLTLTYSFIIGRENTVKFTLSVYVTAFTADGIGNILEKYIFGPNPIHPMITQYGIGGVENYHSIIAKVVFFSLITIFLMWKGNFVADIDHHDSSILSGLITLIMGSFSGILLVAILLVYVNDGSFITTTSYVPDYLSQSIYQQSFFAKILLNNINVWFVLPTIGFIVGSLTSE